MVAKMIDDVTDAKPFGKVRGPLPSIRGKGGRGGAVSPRPVETGVARPGDYDHPSDSPYNLRDFILPKHEQGGQDALDSYGAKSGGMLAYGNDAVVRGPQDAIGVVGFSGDGGSIPYDQPNGGMQGIDTTFSGGIPLAVTAGSGGKYGGPDVRPGGDDVNPHPPDLLGAPDNSVAGPPLKAPPLAPGQLDDMHLADLLTGILGPSSGPPAATGGDVGGSPALVIPITPEASGGGAPAARPAMSKGVVLLLVVGAAVVVFLMWRHSKK